MVKMSGIADFSWSTSDR